MTRAVDTNIVVRWIARDDANQVPIADRMMSEPVHVSLTVLVELAWVLANGRYRFDRATIVEALTGLIDTRSVRVEREGDVRWCISRYAAGADFADMVHLVAASGAAAFATFDRDLAVGAGPDTPMPIVTLG